MKMPNIDKNDENATRHEVSLDEQFQRETRYIVLKLSDVEVAPLSRMERSVLRDICGHVSDHRKELGKAPLDCVVVESDWPEYEPTWAAIEKRMMQKENDGRDAGLKAIESAERPEPLSRTYSCGCVTCICEDEERCHGCGAKSCGKADAECDWKQERIRAIQAETTLAAERPEPVAYGARRKSGLLIDFCAASQKPFAGSDGYDIPLYGPELLAYAERMRAELEQFKIDGGKAILFNKARAERAEAALEKMKAGLREPTNKMLEAGWNESAKELAGANAARACFKAMTAELLRQGEEKK